MSKEQQNRIIAVFMGYYWDEDMEVFRVYGSSKRVWNDLNYHNNWELLMDVGKKIFDWLQEDMKNRPPHTCTEGDLIEVDITCAIRVYNKEEAHKHIVRWIEWYNTQIGGNE